MNEQHRHITLPDKEAKGLVARKSRRDFLIGGFGTVGVIGAYEWITKAKREDGVPWPQRRALEFNGRLGNAYISNSHRMPTFSPAQVGHLKANGNIGMDEPFDQSKWRLELSPADGPQPVHLSMSDILALPKAEMITQFCCIEGWNQVVRWGGARFSDFAQKYLPPGQNFVELCVFGDAGGRLLRRARH